MKKKLNPLGIGAIIVTLVPMVIVVFNRSTEQEVFMKALHGLLAYAGLFFGSALASLLITLLMYGAIKFQGTIYNNFSEEENKLIDSLFHYMEPLMYVIFAVSYFFVITGRVNI